MPTNSLSRHKLIHSLSESFGIEKAEDMVNEAIAGAGFSAREEYSESELREVLKQLKAQGGLVKIIAMSVETRLILGKLR